MPKVNGLHDAIRISRKGNLTVVGELPKPAVAADSVFFSKDQLKIGSILKYYGRHEPNTTWEVTNIWYFPLIRGQYKSHKVTSVITLQDEIGLVCRETGQHMELTFSYLSYSAIWRLVE